MLEISCRGSIVKCHISSPFSRQFHYLMKKKYESFAQRVLIKVNMVFMDYIQNFHKMKTFLISNKKSHYQVCIKFKDFSRVLKILSYSFKGLGVNYLYFINQKLNFLNADGNNGEIDNLILILVSIKISSIFNISVNLLHFSRQISFSRTFQESPSY